MKESSTTPKATTTRGHLLLRGAYLLVALLYWMALYLYVPTLANYVESKTDTLATVGIILAQYGLWQAIIRLPMGVSSDWLGRRKPFILGGIALAGAGAWMMGTADSGSGLLLGRALTGLAASSWVPLTVAFSSLFPPKEAIRATAILTFATSTGRMLATSATGSLNQMGGYSLTFMIATGISVVAFIVMLLAREEVRPGVRPSASSVGQIITRRDVLLPALLAAVAQYANWAITFGFMPLLATRLGASDITLSILLSMNIALATLGSLLAAAAVNKLGARRLTAGTFALISLGIALAALASSLPQVFVAQFLIGVGQGLGYPVLMGMSIRDVDDGQRTTAMGLHQSVYALGMFAGPWLSGIIADAIGIRPMFGVTAGAVLVVALLLVRLLPSRHTRGPSTPKQQPA